MALLNKRFAFRVPQLVLFLIFGSIGFAQNVVVNDDFTGAAAKQSWIALNGACLTAGSSTVISTTNTIPSCLTASGVENSYYAGVVLDGGVGGALPDPLGSGALRLTNDTSQENGAIISNLTTNGHAGFPMSQGLAVTFGAVAYGGTGADGFSFFLVDASVPSTLTYSIAGTTASTINLGPPGGNFGYSCYPSSAPADGLEGAYIGLGIDEFGNFEKSLNGRVPNRIGILGSGNTSWHWLNSNFPSLYPSSFTLNQQQSAVLSTCATGQLWNQSSGAVGTVSVVTYTASTSGSGVTSYLTSTVVTSSLTISNLWVNGAPSSIFNGNYTVIPGSTVVLPSSTPLYTTASTRLQATPLTYQLSISQDGLLSLAYSYNGGTFQPVLVNQPITSASSGTNSFNNGPIPAYVQFGFAGSTGNKTNIHEITCFQAAPSELSSSSAGINTQQSGQVKTGTQVYLAYYHSNGWWGQLTSQNLVYDPVAQVVSIASTANWDASCVLSGGVCNATGGNFVGQQGSGSRNILTWNGIQGIPFQWNNLTSTQQSYLTSGDPIATSSRLLYLRGDRSNEITTTVAGITSGAYRARKSVLGDIIDSSPVWVGPPVSPYPDIWTDSLYGTATIPENASTATYSKFASSFSTRLNVVYTGANDGLVHGFRSGAYDSSGNYVNNAAYPNDGEEVFAYIPSTALQAIHTSTVALDFANPNYSHAFSVDATPWQGDVFYKGSWRTWLVGGMGPGGTAIYALDITDPTTFSETNASSLVVGEWSSTSITCTNVVNCGQNMGQSFGTPQIRRFHNGKWGIVFGNGINSLSGNAGIYIICFDPSTGSQTTYYFDTGSTASANGIVYASPVNIDGDHIIDYVYAGDLAGNVWRFDVTSNNASNWGVSKYGRSSGTPLFTTKSGQPITTQVQVALIPAITGSPRVLVDFGTGQQTPQTLTSGASYAASPQSLYGIWDWDMGNWNKINSSTPMAALTGTQTITTSNLVAQSITSTQNAQSGNVNGYRTVSTNQVCWQASTDCASGNTNFGWTLPLPSSLEQIIYNPVLQQGVFLVNTTIPANNTPLNCSPNANLGWTLAINPGSGSSFTQSYFGNSSNNFISGANGGQVGGIEINAVGSPSIIYAGGNPFLVNQTTSGVGDLRQVNPPPGSLGGRINWQQIR